MNKYHKYFAELDKIENEFYSKINLLEAKMSCELLEDGLEFIWVDNSIVGIGNWDRSMKLVHR